MGGTQRARDEKKNSEKGKMRKMQRRVEEAE